MALPATDSFTDANGTALTSHSASWTLCNGNFDIQSNAVAPNADGEENGAGWNADAFDADQYAELVYVAETGGFLIGPAVRCNVSPDDYFYGFYSDVGASYLFKVVNGAWSQLGNDGASWAINDVARLEISGTTITPLVNDVELDPPGAQTDGAIESGAAGICGYNGGTNTRGDNWEGGNLSAAAIVSGTIAMSGAGALSSSSLVIVSAQAAPSGAGSLSGIGMVEISGSALLSGSGALSSQSLNIALAQAALSGAGSLSAVGVRVAVGAAALSGTGSLAAIALNIAQGQIALSGTGSLSAIALNIEQGQAALSGTGALSAIGAVLGVVEGSAAISGTGDLAAIALNIALGNAALSGTGSLSAIGEILGTVEGAVLLSGSGDLSAQALNIAQGQAALSGSGDLSGAAVLIIPSQALLSGTGSLSAIGNSVSGVLVLGLAVLSGVGALSAGGARFFTPTWREFDPSAETRTYTPSGGRTSTVEAKN